ncbi:hypothetical protein RAS1_17290 [Phycisphaerae bacterium RAS1]|nr:hypothetical protein RAS1_17290 [Phycisphaerae bacterium RAS1]
MKPLLIIPPAPARWPMIERIGLERPAEWWADFKARVSEGGAGAQDAVALIAPGGEALGLACICRGGSIGVLSDIFTRPQHRGRGFARMLVGALLNWFDVTGGKTLHAAAPIDVAQRLLVPQGFEPTRRASDAADARVTLRRGSPAGQHDETGPGAAEVRAVLRGDWPALYDLLQHRPGPDPRVGLDESALGAEEFLAQLSFQQRRGTCVLLVESRAERPEALASLAVDQLGERTYAMILPHDVNSPPLRQAVERTATERGYARVEYPLQALAG